MNTVNIRKDDSRLDYFKQVRLTRKTHDMDGYPIKRDEHLYWLDNPSVELVGWTEKGQHIEECVGALVYINGYPVKGLVNIISKDNHILVLEATSIVDEEAA